MSTCNVHCDGPFKIKYNNFVFHNDFRRELMSNTIGFHYKSKYTLALFDLSLNY
jgi:hypothetical protein